MATTQQNFDSVLKAFTRLQSDLFSAIKPINLITLLGDFFTALSFKKAVKTFIKILELYGAFWSPTVKGLYGAIKLIVSAIIDLSRTCRAVADWVIGLVPKTKDYFKSIFVHQAGTASPTLAYIQNALDEHHVPVIATVDWLSTLIPIVSGLVLLIGGNLACTNKTAEWLMKATSTTGNAATGLVKCFTTSRQVYDGVADSIFTIFGVGKPSAAMQKTIATEKEKQDVEATIAKLNVLCTYLDEMSEQLRKDPQSVLSSPDGPDKIKDALKVSDDMLTEIGNHRFLAAQCRPNIDTLKFKKVQIQKIFEDLLYSMQGKVLPSTLYLCGQAGVGKSRSVTALIDRISFFEGRQLSVYVRSAGVKHWDSYTGQDIVVYDDFGQHAENVDHGELDGIYTPSSYVLPMASIENKGTRFTSPYLIVCSNFPTITKSKIITDPTVLNRRRDFFYFVTDPVHAILVRDGKQMSPETAKEHYKFDYSHLTYTPMERLPNSNGQILPREGKPNGTLYSIAQEMYQLKLQRVQEHSVTNLANVTAFMSGQPKLKDLMPSPVVEAVQRPIITPLKFGFDLTVENILKRIDEAPAEFTLEQALSAIGAPEKLRLALNDEPLQPIEARDKLQKAAHAFSRGAKIKWVNDHLPGGVAYVHGQTIREVVDQLAEQGCFACALARNFNNRDMFKVCDQCHCCYCEHHSDEGDLAHQVRFPPDIVQYLRTQASIVPRLCCSWLFGTAAMKRLVSAHGLADPLSVFNETDEVFDEDNTTLGFIQPDGNDPEQAALNLLTITEINRALKIQPQIQEVKEDRPVIRIPEIKFNIEPSVTTLDQLLAHVVKQDEELEISYDNVILARQEQVLNSGIDNPEVLLDALIDSVPEPPYCKHSRCHGHNLIHEPVTFDCPTFCIDDIHSAIVNHYRHANISDILHLDVHDGNVISISLERMTLCFSGDLSEHELIETTEEHYTHQARAVVDVAKMPIFLLLGTPGTGKTTILKQFRQDTFYELIDEISFSPDTLSYAIEKVWQLYDYPEGESGIIMTANTKTLEKMFLQCYDSDKFEAFMRRVNIFDFSFRRKGIMSLFSHYTPRDITQGHYAQCISVFDRKKNIYCEVADLIALLKRHPIEIEKQMVMLDFEKIPSIDFLPHVHIKLDLTCESTVRKPNLQDFHFVRGQSYFMLFGKLYRQFSSAKWGSIHTALQALSVENVNAGGVYTLLFEMQDASFLVTTQDNGPLKIQEIAELPDFGDIADVQALEMWSNIAFYLEAIFSLSKDALAIWTIYDDICDLQQNQRNAKIAERFNEIRSESKGYYSDSDDDDHFSMDAYNKKAAEFRKLPKSALETKGRSTLGSDPSVPHREHRNKIDPQSRAHKSFLSSYDTQILGPRTSRDHVISVLKENADDIETVQMRNRRIIDLVHNPLRTGIESQSGTAGEAEGRPFQVRRKIVEIAPDKHAPRLALFEDPKTLGKNKLKTPIEYARHENITDKTALDVADVCIMNTVYVLNEDGAMTCRALMIGGRRGISVAHIMPSEGLGPFQVRCADGTVYDATVEKSNFMRDYIIFTIEPGAREFRDITRHFIRRTDVKDYRGFKGLLNVTTFKAGKTIVAFQRSVDIGTNLEYSVDGVRKYGLSYVGRMDSLTTTSAVTSYGDCGSPLIILDTASVRKIIGIHSAASHQKSIASVLYAEDIESVVHQSKPDIKFLRCNAIEPVQDDLTYCSFPVVGKTVIDGTLIKQNAPVTTELYTSPFFCITPGNFEPCLLSSKDPRNPGHDFIHTGPQKWNHPQPDIDEELLDEVVEAWADFFALRFETAGYRNKILTKTESINGVSFIPGSNPIYRHSSAGYPYKHFKGVKQKDTFLSQNPDTLLWSIRDTEHGAYLNDAVDRIIDCAHEQRPGCAFICSLKDEPRKLKKIYGDKPATRTFAAASLDYTIAQRMYFHTAAACFTASHVDIPTKIGIDSKSLDWHMLYYYHTEVSVAGFDMDFADWDATVPKKFMQALPIIYNRIYQRTDPDWQPIHDVIRYNLHSVVHGPLLIIDDTVVQAPGGQVSGQPLTALDNSLVNCLYSYYIFRKLAPPEMQNFSSYLQNVRISVYGDDNMTTVRPSILHWFNFDTYAQECSKLNLVVTPADKSDNYQPYKDIFSMSFLKQSFVKVGPWILGLPEVSSIEKMLSFTRGTRNHKWASERDVEWYDPEIIGLTIDEALHFAFPHGQKYFRNLRDTLMSVCAAKKIRHDHFPTFGEVSRLYIGN